MARGLTAGGCGRWGESGIVWGVTVDGPGWAGGWERAGWATTAPNRLGLRAVRIPGRLHRRAGGPRTDCPAAPPGGDDDDAAAPVVDDAVASWRGASSEAAAPRSVGCCAYRCGCHARGRGRFLPAVPLPGRRGGARGHLVAEAACEGPMEVVWVLVSGRSAAVGAAPVADGPESVWRRRAARVVRPPLSPRVPARFTLSAGISALGGLPPRPPSNRRARRVCALAPSGAPPCRWPPACRTRARPAGTGQARGGAWRRRRRSGAPPAPAAATPFLVATMAACAWKAGWWL